MGRDLMLRDLVLCLPDERGIICAARLTIEAGTTTLLSGPSGSGKSTLFRAISGIWPYGRGAIERPADATVMLLPQRPYIPSGTLKTAAAYPSVAGTYSDEAVREALRLARLSSLGSEIDGEDNWPQRLSGGEQQRLAIARVVLDKPDPDYGLSSAIKVEYKPRTFDCFCGFERWHGTKSSFKKASVRLSLPLFTERRISAGRR